MIFTRDFVTCENYWQITPLVTKKSLFTVTHALFFISCSKSPIWESLLLIGNAIFRNQWPAGLALTTQINPGLLSLPVGLNSSPLDKMAVIMADDNFKCIFFEENDRIPIRISLKFVPRSPIDNKPALAQVMAIGIDTKIEVIVVSFPGRWWHHNDRNRGINFFSIMMPQNILNLCRFGCV